MRSRIACILGAVFIALMFLPASAFAQQFGETSTESRLFNVETGFLAGYRFLNEEPVTGRTVALNFAVMENAELGIVHTMFSDDVGGTDQYNLVRFNYFFIEQLALSLASGSSNNSNNNNGVGGSIGGNFIILRNIPDDGLSSSLKANVQFLFNENDGIGNGTLGVSFLGTIGL